MFLAYIFVGFLCLPIFRVTVSYDSKNHPLSSGFRASLELMCYQSAAMAVTARWMASPVPSKRTHFFSFCFLHSVIKYQPLVLLLLQLLQPLDILPLFSFSFSCPPPPFYPTSPSPTSPSPSYFSTDHWDSHVEFGGTPGLSNTWQTCLPNSALIAPVQNIFFSEIMYHPLDEVSFE